MKIIIKTFALLVFIISLAIAGTWINFNINHTTEIASLLATAEESYNDFTKNYDRSKKTIIILGRSTAVYSFRDKRENADKYSFVDSLYADYNVFSLVNIELFDFDQVKAMLDYGYSKVPEADYVVIENHMFLTSDEIFKGANDLELLLYCLGPAKKMRSCKTFSPIQDAIDEYEFVKNPCVTKFKEELNYSFLKNNSEKRILVKKVLACGNSYHTYERTERLLSKYYSTGFAFALEDKAPVIVNNDGISEPKNMDKNFRKYRQPARYNEAEVLYINKYMNQILRDYPFKQFIFIPNHAREVEDVVDLPVIKDNKDRIQFMDLRLEIAAGKRSYAENYPDGTHPHFWIQDLIADKLIEIGYGKSGTKNDSR